MSGAGDAWDGRQQRPGQQQQPWDRTVGPLTLTLNFRSSSCHNPAQHQLITSTQPASLGLVTSWIISNSNDSNWFHRLIDHWLPFAALSSGIRKFWMEIFFSVPHSCSANWTAGAGCWVHLDVDSVSAEQLPGDTSFEVVMSDADSVEFDANLSLDITPSRATHTANMPGCLGRSRGG